MVINWVRTSWQVVDADFTINENFGLMPSIWECNDESMSHIHILTHMTAEVPLWYPASSDYSNQGKDLMNFRRQ